MSRYALAALGPWLCLTLGAGVACADQSPFLERARALSSQEGARLVRLARATLTAVVAGGAASPEVPEGGEVSPFGLFVTLIKNGRPRGCFGQMEPAGKSLEVLTIEAAEGAARFDRRVRPVSPGELRDIQIIVSIVGPTVPVIDMREVDPKRQGLLLRAGERSSVLLPGEARTSRWQLKRSLRQVGIAKHDPYEMFRFRTVTIYEHIPRQEHRP